MPRYDRAAVAALLAALGVVVSLPWWLPLDEHVYLWMQFRRSCELDAFGRWIDTVVRGVLAALVIAGLVRRDWWQPRRFLALVWMFVIGAGLVEFLKTATERLRPNSTPAMMSGNSFPSGHTTGATMAAAIAVLLISQRDWPRPVRWGAYAAAAACALLQGVGRLVNGSHWASDVTVSILLGVAWVLGAQSLRRVPKPITVGVLVVVAAAFAVFDDVPGIRFHLPSALDESRPSIAAVEFGTNEARGALVGGWGDGPAEPIGPVSWALAKDVGVRLRTEDAKDGAILKLALRPFATPGEHACSHIVISVNDWVSPKITLVRGWREYHLEPPAGVLRPGDNTIRFQIVAAPDAGEPAPGLAAFRYLRLYPQA